MSEDLSAVSNLTPDKLDEELGAGKTDTEASESMRNLLELRESCRQIKGDEVEGPAGRV